MRRIARALLRKPGAPALRASQRIAAADAFFAATRATTRHGGTQVYYAIGPDYVHMPPFETFIDAESHAATLAHELIHWPRYPSSLNRDLGRANGAMKAMRARNW